MIDRARKQAEVDANYEAFRAKLPELLQSHPGKFAVLRDREVIEFFDTARDAAVFGQRTYPDGVFSVQEIIDRPADFGWYSHAADYASR